MSRDVGGERTDHLQYAYRMECLKCGYVYGANGSDISARRCPKCDEGAEGIPYLANRMRNISLNADALRSPLRGEASAAEFRR